MICSVDSCARPVNARGLCNMHYKRWLAYGDAEEPSIRDPVELRLARSTEKVESGCWLWTGLLDHGGYGSIRIDGHNRRTHRVAYELAVGPIPKGLTLDHLCRVRRCLNPAHLEAVSNRVNVLRGRTPAAANRAKTHCPKGHEYTPENTYVRSRDGRQERMCRVCNREAQRRSRARRITLTCERV